VHGLVSSAVEPFRDPDFPNITVVGDVLTYDAQRVARAVGEVLRNRGLGGEVRVRLSVAALPGNPLVVQVNLGEGDTALRMQTVIRDVEDLVPVQTRLVEQIVRTRRPWRPRRWPDRSRCILSAPELAVIARRKLVPLARATPLDAAAAMDAMDYDVHLFTDAETGEEAVVYRAGPSGLRLNRQRHVHPPGGSRAPIPPPQPLVVNPRPTPVLSDDDALARLCEHSLGFLFYTDPDSGRGRLLYPRYDGGITLIAPAT